MTHRCIIYQGTSAGTIRAVIELPARPGDIMANGATVAAPAPLSALDGAVDAYNLDVCRVPAQRKQYTSKLARGFGDA